MTPCNICLKASKTYCADCHLRGYPLWIDEALPENQEFLKKAMQKMMKKVTEAKP